jgi:hypothetical protein
MIPHLSSGLRAGVACLIAAASTVGTHTPAWAQQPAPPAAAPAPEAAPAPGAPAAEAAAPASTAMAVPAMAGPLVANPNPFSVEGPLGKVYVTGAISGLALFQSDPVPGDHSARGDISNGHVIMQTTDGLVQGYVQAGVYSFPTVGSPYVSAPRTTGDTFGPLPLAFLKLAPNDAFNVQVGKLPTLFGAEDGFTFQNMNIERGLLWAQEPIVSRGVQLNYTQDPFTLALSVNDGFYSDAYNWLVGSLAYAPDKINTFTIVGGGNVDHTGKNAFSATLPAVFKTPNGPNNGAIVDLEYTYSNAPWTITPYFQYTHASGNAFLGTPIDNGTVGGALLANYSVNDNVNVAGRFEFIASTGSSSLKTTNLLYGPGSSALSFTLTPTWQQGIFFVRADASVVTAFSTTAGFAFGKTGNTTTQGRLVFETGIVF